MTFRAGARRVPGQPVLAQSNIRSTQAAHRVHLQQSAVAISALAQSAAADEELPLARLPPASPAPSGRPPSQPRGYPPKSPETRSSAELPFGRHRASTTNTFANPLASPSASMRPSSHGSSTSGIGGSVGASPTTASSPSSSLHGSRSSTKKSRSLSLRTPAPASHAATAPSALGGACRSPPSRGRSVGSVQRPHSSGSNCDASPVGDFDGNDVSDRSDRGWGLREDGAGDDNDEDAFEQQLADLEELSRHLDLVASDDARIGTAGTSSSVPSTAAPSGGGGSSSRSRVTVSAGSGGSDIATDRDDAILDRAPRPPQSDDPYESLRGSQRVHYELQNCSLPHGCRVETSAGSFGQLFLSIDVGEGPYTPATMVFWIKIFADYPESDNVSIRCTKRIFHPNVDQESGAMELDDDQIVGKPGSNRLLAIVGTIRRSICNPTDTPLLNHDAAMLLQTDPNEFRRIVRLTLGGGEHRGVQYDRVISGTGGQGTLCADVGRAKSAQPQMADHIRVEMMKLEVMRDQFKEQASDMQRRNEAEIQHLLPLSRATSG
eukprot:TRINITY_DN22299_c0_g1_i1.p1 TRINITY_DN22299_c0_g1~~TRINITY_DN22299_c0_g1_i1.p1  ORF type:complete len:549 (+),score=79.35 TRINITY_DN22299_c0_g1_i1:165-1811(+)